MKIKRLIARIERAAKYRGDEQDLRYTLAEIQAHLINATLEIQKAMDKLDQSGSDKSER